jgi:hypothetical protein
VNVRNRKQDLVEDRQPILAWRIDRLRDAGFAAGLAAAVARDPRYDVHALLELTDRGCPADLAARILCPLDDEYRSVR